MAVRKRIDIILGARDKASRVLGGFRRRMMGVLKSIAVMGAAAAGVAVAMAMRGVIKAGAGFEHTMARVRALTQASEVDFKRLSAQAQKLGATTEHSASQAAEAMANFALAGFSVNEIMAAMPATLSLASAGQLDVGQASDIAAKLMAGMGLNAAELGDAVDILAKAFTTANTDLTMLGDAMSYVGPVARTAGYDLAEVAAVIQVLSNAGIQGQQAGTALRRMMLSLASPSREAEGLLKKLGVSVNDAAGDMRSMADIVEDLRQSTKAMGTGQRLGILGTIFGARGATGAAALIDAGATSIRNFERELRSAGGTAQRIAKTQMDTLTGSWIRFKSAAEGAAITVFESMKGPLRSGIDMGVRAMQWLRNAWIVGTTSMGFYLENWKTVALLALLSVQKGMVDLKDRTIWAFTKVIPDLLKWFARNWREVFIDIFNFSKTVFTNLVLNIIDVLKTLPQLLSGEIELWQIWRPLTQGFESALKELPEIAKFESSELAKKLGKEIGAIWTDLGEELAERIAERLGEFDAAAVLEKTKLDVAGAPGAPGAPGAAGRDGRKGVEFLELGPQFRGLAAIFRATEDPMKVTARQTTEIARRTKENGRTLKTMLAKMQSSGGEEGVPLF